MPRGFQADVGGGNRLRMVKAGYDAFNFGLPYNLVAFDSAYPRNIVPWATGIVRVSTPQSWGRIVSWPSPGYYPMTIVVAKPADGSWISVVPWTSNNPVIYADSVGLILYTGSFNLPIDIFYFAMRVPA